jgi:hypothetical protein
MSTIATTTQRADSIDYWVRRHLFHYCYGAHPSQSGSKRKPPWDRSIILSAIGHVLRTSTPSRPTSPHSSLRSSNNSKRRNTKRRSQLPHLRFDLRSRQ